MLLPRKVSKRKLTVDQFVKRMEEERVDRTSEYNDFAATVFAVTSHREGKRTYDQWFRAYLVWMDAQRYTSDDVADLTKYMEQMGRLRARSASTTPDTSKLTH